MMKGGVANGEYNLFDYYSYSHRENFTYRQKEITAQHSNVSGYFLTNNGGNRLSTVPHLLTVYTQSLRLSNGFFEMKSTHRRRVDLTK